ncbi:hypothetical protein ACH4FX_13715 [Streptomyces sp. NPDC018019]|uniref:hypothetical protein n=1 Tax=Streptomyces sp. NPDC018019 TaxID=3365030 RepID=UPI003789895F
MDHEDGGAYLAGGRRPLWVEEPAARRRMPDPVRTAAVRAVIIAAVTLIQAMVAFFCAMAGAWFAFPAVLSTVASTVVATWAVLDVWVTRQVWVQRNGVRSQPSSTARSLRRERRQARRQARREARGAHDGREGPSRVGGAAA